MTGGQLWPHQAAAVDAVCGELGGGGRATVVAACGTGKTVVGAEVSRRLAPGGPVLVVVPTLELLAQTARAYAAWLGAAAGHIVAVCGDAAAAADEAHEVRAQIDGLAAQVTTDPATVAAVARCGGRVSVLSTYASLPAIAAAHYGYGLGRWELVVVDEAHRSAGHGAKAWAVVHWDAQIPAARRVYLTATPRIITGTSGEETVSMDDAAVFGRIVHEVPFAQAISQGLLADYRVAVAVVSDAEAAKLTAGTVLSVAGRPLPARMAACQVALLRAIRQWDLRRVIAYHGRVARAVRFAATLPDTLDLLGPADRPARPVTADYVTGATPLAVRRQRLGLLADPGQAAVVISNARVLAEGVDVPELDAIMLADPKDSATDVVQAVGRALRRGTGPAKTATIIVPVLATDGQPPDHALEGPEFQTVWRVVRALRAHDERIAAWLDEHRAQLHTTGPHNQEVDLPPWLHVSGAPVTAAFTQAISVRVVNAAAPAWPVWHAALADFRATHGHANPPRSWCTSTGMALGGWLHAQRAAHRAGRLSPQRVAALEELGIDWSPFGAAWWRGLEYAAAYRAATGTLSIPDRYHTSTGFDLGSWLAQQRSAYRNGKLVPERVAALEQLGIDWDPLDAAWQRALAHATAYHATTGHLSVPKTHRAPGGFDLGSWLTEQRSAHRAGKLTPERVAALEQLGITWDTKATRWQTGLAHLRTFHHVHGHANVPPGYHTSDGFALHRWLARARSAQRAGNLPPNRTADLQAAGVSWQPRQSSWEPGVAALTAYVTEHGDARVPRHYKTAEGFPLGTWIHTQRDRRRDPGRNQCRPLTTEQITTLDQLGMIWDPSRTPRPSTPTPNTAQPRRHDD
jgi:superfamily II DNA or RNA helicase